MKVKKIEANAKNYFKDNKNGWRPMNLNLSTGVLLIQRANTKDGKQQKKMEDFMKANYPYQFEFFESIYTLYNDSNYSDRDRFRFVLAIQWQQKDATTKYDLGEGRKYYDNYKIGNYDFHFIDRKEDKSYPNTYEGGSYAVTPLSKIINNILNKD
jgi:hypothetical protein